MGTELTFRAPGSCGHGHVLRYGGRDDADFIPGRVTNSFVSCLCPSARAKPGSKGHVATECAGCRQEDRETIFTDPPCEKRGSPGSEPGFR